MQQELSHQVKKLVNSDAGFMLNNPVDVTNLATTEAHHVVLKALATYEGIDLLVGQFSVNNAGWPYADSNFSTWPEFFIEALIEAHRETDKTVAMIIHGVPASWDMQKALKLQQQCCEAGLPVFRSPAGAARAIDRFLRYHERNSGRGG